MAALKPWLATLLQSFASRFREMEMQRTSQARATSAARIANQVLMNVETGGEVDAQGRHWMKWSAFSSELEAVLGVPPLAAFRAMARYGLVLDVQADRLTINRAAAPLAFSLVPAGPGQIVRSCRPRAQALRAGRR
jgi:hypothetical protein